MTKEGTKARRSVGFWTPETRDYVEACYAGKIQSSSGAWQRLFRWPPEDPRHEGAMDDFLVHLEEEFDATLAPGAWGTVHAILRRRGYRLWDAPHPNGRASTLGMSSGKLSRFNQPEPDQELEPDDDLKIGLRLLADGFLWLAIWAEKRGGH